MHILGHNPAVWAIVCIGLQGEFFDRREPNREATAEELKMLQYNAQACDILFNGLCPEEFVGIFDTGVPILSCMRPAARLHRRLGLTHFLH